jgi:hypothetical protein
MSFVQDLLQPAVDDVDRARRGIPGDESLAVWQEDGAVFVGWKAPTPAAALALAGVRSDGVTVIAQPVEYSEHDLSVAMDKVTDAFDDHEVHGEYSSVEPCSAGSGVLVGVVPKTLTAPKALAARLTRLAGIPVYVVPQVLVTAD